MIGSTVTLEYGGRQLADRVIDLDLDSITLAGGQRVALAALQSLRPL